MTAHERLSWLGQVVAWLVILAVATILVLAVAVPRVTGATPYTVLTGSMRPAYPPGTLVVVKPSEEIGIGSVVSYQLESGKPVVVTHRVVAVGVNSRGERTLTTRGDANDTADAAAVRPVQVKGEVWYAVPLVGHLSNALSGGERRMAIYALATLLLAYSALMLTGAVREPRRERQGAP